MSIFKTKWIVLKKINKEKQTIYIVFSQDYWKINLISNNSSKEKRIDLWYIISFEIKTYEKNDIMKIKNIKIINEFNYLNYNFETIFLYQIILTIIYKIVPAKKQIFNILEIFEKINLLSNKKNLWEEKIREKIIFSWLKILNILWFLNINHKNPEIKKILFFINNNNFQTILKLTWLSLENKKILEKIITEKIK